MVSCTMPCSAFKRPFMVLKTWVMVNKRHSKASAFLTSCTIFLEPLIRYLFFSGISWHDLLFCLKLKILTLSEIYTAESVLQIALLEDLLYPTGVSGHPWKVPHPLLFPLLLSMLLKLVEEKLWTSLLAFWQFS